MVFLAYRAILAEPRTKAAATEDYSGGAARGDYMGAADSMNQYALPLGTQSFVVLIIFFLFCHVCVLTSAITPFDSLWLFCPPAVVLLSNLFFNEWVPGLHQDSK